jgi:hypothetical protein
MVSGWDSRDGVVASLRFSPLPESFFVLPSLGVLRTHEGLVVGEADRSSTDTPSATWGRQLACPCPSPADLFPVPVHDFPVSFFHTVARTGGGGRIKGLIGRSERP